MKQTIAWLALVLILFSSRSHANLIIDTGPGPGLTPGGWSLNSNQWLGAEFVLDTASVITEVEGWIGGSGGVGTIAIYNSNNGIPANELFSSSFTVESFLDNTWHGASGLSWMLGEGRYVVSFEVRLGDTLQAFMEDPSPAPLANELFYNTSNQTWLPSQLGLGIRISGAPLSVSAPSVLFLCLTVIIGLVYRRARS